MSSKPSRLHSVLVGWVAVTAIFPTLIVYRAAFNPEYQWGLFGVSGTGMSPGFAFIVAAAAWAWALVVLGKRQSQLFAMPLVGWNAFLFLSMILGVMEWGSAMVLRGDAYGMRLNLAVAGPLLTGAMLVLNIVWLRRTRHHPTAAAGTLPRPSRRVIGFALALAPVIALLFFRHGAEHTNRDRVAVALTILQCITITSALGARRDDAAAAEA